MIVGAAAERPVIFALALLDRKIVDACNPQPHQSVLVELPVFVSIAAEPVPAVVAPFIGKSHRNAVFAKGPDLFDQTIVELAIPLARQERFDGLAALQKFGAIAPATVDRICEATRAGSRVFQASSAMRAFAAVSVVNGEAAVDSCTSSCKLPHRSEDRRRMIHLIKGTWMPWSRIGQGMRHEFERPMYGEPGGGATQTDPHRFRRRSFGREGIARDDADAGRTHVTNKGGAGPGVRQRHPKVKPTGSER